MAIDRWLLAEHLQGRQPSSLRFYTWNPPAISLGYHQRRCPTHWQTLTWNQLPIDFVRRPTGGRAVLHQGDLTYALVTSGLTGTRLQAYQQLCEFLIQGWGALHVPLHFGQARRGYIHNPNCFGTATGADLVMSDGTKLIGSAQLWRSHGVLQQGSMQLQPDAALFQQVFGSEIQQPDLPTALQSQNGHRQIMDALTIAAQQVFQVQFHVQSLTESEWDAIQT